MRKRTYLKLASYQNEETEKHIAEVRSIHAEMRGYKHDFHHHLETLKGYLSSGEIERARAYIDELDERLFAVDTLLKTGNVTLDAILSAKIAKAKAERIAVKVKAVVPEELTLSDVELSILVGNLLDNAVEACREAAGEKFIRLYIAMKGKMLYFSMLNAAGEKRRKEHGLFETQKPGLHGFGLRRVSSVIENRGGWIKANSEEGAFSTEFLVPALA